MRSAVPNINMTITHCGFEQLRRASMGFSRGALLGAWVALAERADADKIEFGDAW